MSIPVYPASIGVKLSSIIQPFFVYKEKTAKISPLSLEDLLYLSDNNTLSFSFYCHRFNCYLRKNNGERYFYIKIKTENFVPIEIQPPGNENIVLPIHKPQNENEYPYLVFVIISNSSFENLKRKFESKNGESILDFIVSYYEKIPIILLLSQKEAYAITYAAYISNYDLRERRGEVILNNPFWENTVFSAKNKNIRYSDLKNRVPEPINPIVQKEIIPVSYY